MRENPQNLQGKIQYSQNDKYFGVFPLQKEKLILLKSPQRNSVVTYIKQGQGNQCQTPGFKLKN